MVALNFFVDTASSGGDGTTRNHSGSTAAFSDINDATTTLAADTSINGDDVTIWCQGGADTANPVFVSWTSTPNSVTVRADDGSVTGVGTYDDDGQYIGNLAWSTSHYRIAPDQGNTVAFDFTLTFIDMQVENAISSGAGAISRVFFTSTNGVSLTLRRSRVRNNPSVQADCRMVNFNPSADTGTLTIDSCVFQCKNAPDPSTEASHFLFIQGDVDVDVYNSTFDGNADAGTYDIEFGLRVTGAGTVRFYNNVVVRTGDDINASGTIANNATEDGDGTSAVTITTVTDEMEDPDNATAESRDYRPKSTGSIDGAGSATLAHSTDIKGVTANSPPDIGAFALVAAGGGPRGPFGHPLNGPFGGPM